jgi:YidC/Oxa1 family membrane protein insertase
MDKRTLLFMICVSLAFFGVNAYYAKYEKPAAVAKKVEVVLPKESPTLITQNFAPATNQEEKFYVLENEYQQLVFSSRGASLAEINLPLRTISPNSYVKEIDFDRLIVKNSPQNARFPLGPYMTADGSEQKEGALGGYYPLLRRGMNGNAVLPEYYALNIVSDSFDAANVNYRVSRFESDLIEFQGSVNGTQITKRYTIPKTRNGPYCFNLDILINGEAKGLWLSSGVPDVEIVSDSYTPNLRIQVTKNKMSDVESIDLPTKGPIQVSSPSPNWISNCNGFLGVIMDPLTEIGQGYKTVQVEGTKIPTRLALIDPGYYPYKPVDYPGYITYLPLKSGAMQFRIFAGPYDHDLLKDLDALYEEPLKNYNPEYTAALSIQGWFSFISQPFSKFLSLLMGIFYAITHSWAFSIVLLTIALKAMMYPLNNWSARSAIKMQEIGPKVKAVQEKHKKDPKKAQMEVMNLYRESGINPITGCLPALLQMPFLIGMFYLLKSSFPLRGAVFISGWIDDLSTPDILFGWNQPLWFIGNEFHLLPILNGFAMYFQQKMTSKLPKDSSKLTDAQKQQKMMSVMLPVLITVMFYNFPSGLNIYFLLSTLLGIAQQAWIMKKMNLGPKKT